MTHEDPDQETVAAAIAGDEEAFAKLVSRHRRELHLHCYRMLASFEEAEDVLQETLLRAWSKRETFDGSSLFRAWLYRIATNACLDVIRQKARRVPAMASFAEVPWLQPYPDRLLDEATVAKETIELGFIALVQLLPPKQRAVFVLRDVLDWSAAETAETLATSVASANSALQRARATLEERLPQGSPRAPLEAERELVRRFIEAHEREDVGAAVMLLSEDVRVTMPPHPFVYTGRDAVATLIAGAFDRKRFGSWRLLPTSANHQPAAASYLRRPGDTVYRAFKLDVLRVQGNTFVEMTTFDPRLFAAFGLPATLPEDER
jgi:RNA polymerase sigma-70 factor (TIGR02960 family)